MESITLIPIIYMMENFSGLSDLSYALIDTVLVYEGLDLLATAFSGRVGTYYRLNNIQAKAKKDPLLKKFLPTKEIVNATDHCFSHENREIALKMFPIYRLTDKMMGDFIKKLDWTYGNRLFSERYFPSTSE